MTTSEEATKDNWASISEDMLLLNLFDEIEQDKKNEDMKRTEAIKYITNILDNINVSFEPDPTYRDNVKYIIIGLVLSQILKQKTINLFRKGKEDREYLGSYLMMKIQLFLINNNEVRTWNSIIRGIYTYYQSKVQVSTETKVLIQAGINQNKIIPGDILVSTVLSNKKNYKIRTGYTTREYS